MTIILPAQNITVTDDEGRIVDLSEMRVESRAKILDAERGLVGLEIRLEDRGADEALREVCGVD